MKTDPYAPGCLAQADVSGEDGEKAVKTTKRKQSRSRTGGIHTTCVQMTCCHYKLYTV